MKRLALVACCVASLAPAIAAQSAVLWTASATATGQGFGNAVGGLGDLDGDGVRDVAVGAPGASPGGLSGAGQVRVLSGASGLTLLVKNGSVPGEKLGSSVCGMGDVNGDGVSEFIVGSLGAVGGGVARVFSGVDGSLILSLSDASGPILFGSAVADVGDTNGDGIPDVAVGAPGPSFNFAFGRVRVFSGSDGAPLVYFEATGGFGLSVAGPGDIDGDGSGDVIGGAPFALVFDPGQAFLFSGASGTLLRAFLGLGSSEQLGRAVLGPGDLDGDGAPDLAVGGACVVRAYSGATGVPLFVQECSSIQAAGRFLAAPGDVDGDGTPDVAAGTATLLFNTLFGEQLGRVRILSGATGLLLSSVPPAGSPQGLGSVVADAGDLDGDGAPDLFIGSPLADPAALTDGGEARAISLAGLPAPGVTPFGTGCAGSGGLFPKIGTTGGPPTVGNAGFSATLRSALGGTTAVLVAGYSAQVPPLHLAAVGAPYCFLFVNPEQFLSTTTGGAGPGVGNAFLPIPIAPDPALAGISIYYQWYVVDPGPLVVPGATTQAIAVVVQ
jgi:hypothetical protein